MDIAIKNVISAVVYLANNRLAGTPTEDKNQHGYSNQKCNFRFYCKRLAGTPTEDSAALWFSRKLLRHKNPLKGININSHGQNPWY
nr:hypothetical protein [Bacteroidota bacterium]